MILPWFFANKYETLEDCDEVLDEIKWFTKRGMNIGFSIMLVTLLFFALAVYLYDDGILLEDIYTGMTYITGIVFGSFGGWMFFIGEMQSAVNERKKEILDEMWDEGHPAEGQFSEEL